MRQKASANDTLNFNSITYLSQLNRLQILAIFKMSFLADFRFPLRFPLRQPLRFIILLLFLLVTVSFLPFEAVTSPVIEYSPLVDAERESLNHLVLVPCHSIYIGLDYSHSALQRMSNWFLLSYQNQQQKEFITHMRLAARQTSTAASALLIFSGGKRYQRIEPKAVIIKIYW